MWGVKGQRRGLLQHMPWNAPPPELPHPLPTPAGTTHKQLHDAAMEAIFQGMQPAHRFSMKRWSRSHPNTFRWVLYELRPLMDPVAREPAVMIVEQNITQARGRQKDY